MLPSICCWTFNSHQLQLTQPVVLDDGSRSLATSGGSQVPPSPALHITTKHGKLEELVMTIETCPSVPQLIMFCLHCLTSNSRKILLHAYMPESSQYDHVSLKQENPYGVERECQADKIASIPFLLQRFPASLPPLG